MKVSEKGHLGKHLVVSRADLARETMQAVADYRSKQQNGESTRLYYKDINTVLGAYAQVIAEHLSVGDSVLIRGLGRLDVEKTPDYYKNFRGKERFPTSKKHEYMSIKFVPSRVMKSKLTSRVDELKK